MPLDPCQTFSPSLGTVSNLTSKQSIPVVQDPSQLGDKRVAVGDTPFSVATYISSCSSGFGNVDLTKEMLEKASSKNIRDMGQKLKKQVKEGKGTPFGYIETLSK